MTPPPPPPTKRGRGGPGGGEGLRIVNHAYKPILCNFHYLAIHRLIYGNHSAVYTCIKNPSFSHIPVFRWKLLGNYPYTLQKTRIEKPTSEVWFFETPPVFHWFFANVNTCSPLTVLFGFLVFGHVGRDLLRNHPRPATYCALRTVRGREKSRMRITYQKTSMRFGVFRACAFLAKKSV